MWFMRPSCNAPSTDTLVVKAEMLQPPTTSQIVTFSAPHLIIVNQFSSRFQNSPSRIISKLWGNLTLGCASRRGGEVVYWPRSQSRLPALSLNMPHPLNLRWGMSHSRFRHLLAACTFILVSYYYVYRSLSFVLSSSKPRDAAGNSTLGVSFPFLSFCLGN